MNRYCLNLLCYSIPYERTQLCALKSTRRGRYFIHLKTENCLFLAIFTQVSIFASLRVKLSLQTIFKNHDQVVLVCLWSRYSISQVRSVQWQPHNARIYPVMKSKCMWRPQSMHVSDQEYVSRWYSCFNGALNKGIFSLQHLQVPKIQ